MTMPSWTSLILLLACFSVVLGSSSSDTAFWKNGREVEDRLLVDISSFAHSPDSALSAVADIPKAARDFSDRHGMEAYEFLRGLASSSLFRDYYWHRRPLLLRAKDITGGWVADCFTMDDLKLIDGSYISGHKTADVLRNGTKTDTWEFLPLKANVMQPTTWSEVEQALKGGTIYFNTAGSLWPTLGGLCRICQYAFGLPTNVNVYVTPPGVSMSVPPHTDRQDVMVFQSLGAKRWRVYAPPKRGPGKDPLNRGKSGDVLSEEELGTPLLDTVIHKGDFLYVPTGFPHTTDTTLDGQAETSLHLTMGLDTHVWGLTKAHLRWSLLQRCQKQFNLNLRDDQSYWEAMEAIPVGFLGGEDWKRSVNRMRNGQGIDPDYRKRIVEEVKNMLVKLEPDRWIAGAECSANDERETLPSDDEIGQVVEYMVETHLGDLIQAQEDLFSNIDPHDQESVYKAFQGTQLQNKVMEKFGEFSKNEAMRKQFEKMRLDGERKTRGL